MNIMPNADPIFDLGQCAQALAHGHDPAEIAVRLQGIIERLRQVRTAEDERRDVLRFIAAQASDHDLHATDGALSHQSRAYHSSKALALQYIHNRIEHGDHVSSANRER